jgi:hypothetical protein
MLVPEMQVFTLPIIDIFCALSMSQIIIPILRNKIIEKYIFMHVCYEFIQFFPKYKIFMEKEKNSQRKGWVKKLNEINSCITTKIINFLGIFKCSKHFFKMPRRKKITSVYF